MAIIKCPECGHQISDKAPVCPSCGVEIAGKVIKCPNCGEVYFKVQEMCPNCHRPTYQAQVPPVTDPKPVTPPVPPVPPTTPAAPASPVSPTPSATPTAPATPRPTAQGSKQDAEGKEQPKQKKPGLVFIISAIFSILVCGIFYYFYDSANKNKEQEAYEYAMQS